MLRKYDKSLILDIKHSYFLGSVFVFLGVGALLIVSQLSLPAGMDWALAGAAITSTARQLCQHVLGCSRRAVRRIKLESSGACAVVHDAIDSWQDSRVIGWYVQPWLVILRLQADEGGGQRAVLVAWDAVPQDLFRELRVRVYGLRRAVAA